MPISDIHKKKLKKNIAIALLIFLWCAIIWAVTMIKIANAHELPPVQNPYSPGNPPVAKPNSPGKAAVPQTNTRGKAAVPHPNTGGKTPHANPNSRKPPVHYHYRGRDYTGVGLPPNPVDRKGALYKDRFDHREKSAATKEEWDAVYNRDSDARHNRQEDLLSARRTHGDKTYMIKDRWDKTYLDEGEARLEKDRLFREDRAAHRDMVTEKPRGWWDAWSAEQEIKKAEQMR